MDLLQFVRGCTFDDFLFTPQHGILPRSWHSGPVQSVLWTRSD